MISSTTTTAPPHVTPPPPNPVLDHLLFSSNPPLGSCVNQGHIMVNPVEESSCFAMLVYKNGSLARERVRNEVRAVPRGRTVCRGRTACIA